MFKDSNSRIGDDKACPDDKPGVFKPVVFKPVKPFFHCSSYLDPHIFKFDGTMFETHAIGWKTLYAKGNLQIDLKQAPWKHNGRATVNSAVRYSTDGGTTWDETVQDGQLLSSGATKRFAQPDVKLTVSSSDYSAFEWAAVNHIYNVYITTRDEYKDATGQCVQGKLPNRRARLRGRRLESSDGVVFPSGDDVKVSKEQAELACAGLGKLKASCVTDLRLVNEPEAVEKMKEDFETVKDVQEKLETTTTTSTTTTTTTTTTETPTVSPTETPTSSPTAATSATTTMHLCVSVLALVTLLVV